MYIYMQVYDIQVHVYNYMYLVCLTCTVYKSVVKQVHTLFK